MASLKFLIQRPAGAPQWKQWPIGREAGGTDVDKLLRAVLDGVARTEFTVQHGKNKGQRITRGAEAFSDDGNVVAVDDRKYFTRRDEHPGCQIRMWSIDRAIERLGWVPVPCWPGWRYVRREEI